MRFCISALNCVRTALRFFRSTSSSFFSRRMMSRYRFSCIKQPWVCAQWQAMTGTVLTRGVPQQGWEAETSSLLDATPQWHQRQRLALRPCHSLSCLMV